MRRKFIQALAHAKTDDFRQQGECNPFGAPDDGDRIVTKPAPQGCRRQGLTFSRLKGRGIWRFSANKIGQTQRTAINMPLDPECIRHRLEPDGHQLYAVMNGMDNFHTRLPAIYSSWQAAFPPEPLLRSGACRLRMPYAYYDHLLGKTYATGLMEAMEKIEGRATALISH